MRRGGDKSGTNTNTNSEGPSKSTSEAGGGSSDGGDDKDKSALTREAREARYKEVRQRIFGAAEAAEDESAEAYTEQKDLSRSSSASGKKKGKKERNYDDDGFEARSRFNIFYPQPFNSPAYGGDPGATYYGQIPAAALQTQQQFPAMGPTASPVTYNGNYPVMHQDNQSQYGWPNQGFQPNNVPANYPNYNGAVPASYDLSAEFQRGMSFQTSPMPSQVTPKMSVPTMAPYSEPYRPQNMPMNQTWPQAPHQHGYPMNQQFAQGNHGDRSAATPGQGPVPGQYPYGQFPSLGFNAGKNRNQHPLPGSFNRQQFNPQSQAFVPTHRNSSFPMQPNMQPKMQSNMQQMPSQNMNGYSSYPAPMGNQMSMVSSMPLMNQMQRPSPPSTQQPSFNASRAPQSAGSTPSKSNGQGISHPLPQPVPMSTSSQAPPSHPGNPSAPAQSSIAKWGTPSHLPPKPPPPAQPQPPKFTLPGHSFAAVPRPVGNMPQAFPMNVAVSVRGGATGPSDGRPT
jgi:hypothetical protein